MELEFEWNAIEWEAIGVNDEERQEIESNMRKEIENAYLQFGMRAKSAIASLYYEQISSSLVGAVIRSNVIDMTISYSLSGNHTTTYTKNDKK